MLFMTPVIEVTTIRPMVGIIMTLGPTGDLTSTSANSMPTGIHTIRITGAFWYTRRIPEERQKKKALHMYYYNHVLVVKKKKKCTYTPDA